MIFIKKNLSKILIKENISIEKTLKKLNSSGIPICFVVNNKKQIIGSITDGDIRRKIVKNFEFHNQIKSIMNKNPIMIHEKQNDSEASYIMKNKSILFVPKINDKKEIVGLYCWNNVLKREEIKNTVVVMAGGYGKRLRPLTNKLPKPMLKIGGKPILEHILLSLKDQGIVNIIITVHYKSEKIISYFKNGKKIGLNIKYIKEIKPLGTAGFIKKIKNIDKPFFIINGDVLCNFNLGQFLKFHKKNKSFATMGVRTINSVNPYGVVKIKGQSILNVTEKPVKKLNINSGIYLLNPNVINFLKNSDFGDFINMTDVFLKLIPKKKILHFPLLEKWVDIGDMESFKIAKKYIEKNI